MGTELDLFASSNDPSAHAMTIAMVTRRARTLIESGFPQVWVKGEIANFKSFRSGHWYFSMRDDSAQIRCVMWRDDARKVPDPPTEGTQVFAECRPTVWEERGEFRLTVKRLIPTAIEGKWDLELQRARAALQRDGLLDPARKRPLPPFPARVGVVTSQDGAALRDILAVLRRRWPSIQVLLVPTRVQGEGAAQDIARAVQVAGRIRELDVLIVGRGGGSREDLWAFNDEGLARVIADFPRPTVSAVGHETDVTLIDLVADLRAATPSAAAEAVVPDRSVALRAVDQVARRLGHALTGRVYLGRERLERTTDRLVASIEGHVTRRKVQVATLAARLDALSPLRVLDRGFSVAHDATTGRVLKMKKDFVNEQRFKLTVRDGTVDAIVADRSP